MSELSEKKNTVTESLSGANDPSSQAQLKVKPVKVWALVGAAVLALQLYVWIRWVTGPYFARVPEGPSDPPMYMKIPLVVDAPSPCGSACRSRSGSSWLKPWLRERRISLDGMLLVPLGLMGFQDPLLNYTNTWCSTTPGCSTEAPGPTTSRAGSRPRRQVDRWPTILTNVPGYTLGRAGAHDRSAAGPMRKIKTRWPGIGNLRLVGVTFLICDPLRRRPRGPASCYRLGCTLTPVRSESVALSTPAPTTSGRSTKG